MKCKQLLSLITLAALVLTGCSAAPQTNVADTPEKAVSAYVAALAAGDYNAALSLCPADTMMQNFHADAYNKTEVSTGKTPTVDAIKLEYAQQTFFLASSLLQGEAAGKAGTTADAAATTQYLKDNADKLKDLQALRIDKPYRAAYDLEADSDVYKESTKTGRQAWGAQDITERIVLLQHNGRTFMAGFTLVEYNGIWGIRYATSAFADLPTTGNARQMGQEEYLKHVRPSAMASK